MSERLTEDRLSEMLRCKTAQSCDVHRLVAEIRAERARADRLAAALEAMHTGMVALNTHHRDDHHGGVDLLLDEDVAEAFLAYRRVTLALAEAAGGEGER